VCKIRLDVPAHHHDTNQQSHHGFQKYSKFQNIEQAEFNK
jgi:hypothetical protein